MAGLNELIRVFSMVDDEKKMKKLFEELFTTAERKTFELRWNLLKQLHEGVPQRDIAERLGISLCKITRGSKILKDKNSAFSEILNSHYKK